MRSRIIVVGAAVLLLGVSARGQIVDTGGESGLAGKVAPAADSKAAASSAEEQRSRQLLQLKAERSAAASKYAAGDPRLAEFDEQIVTIQKDLAASTASSPGLFVDSATGPLMSAPFYPRIVPAAYPPVEQPVEMPRVVASHSSDLPAPSTSTSVIDSAANREIRAVLEARVSLAADAKSIAAVFEDLAAQTHANLYINWTALQTAGIDKNTPVTLHLAGVSATRALRAILDQAGGATTNLNYTIDEGVLTISTREDLSSAKYQAVRVYNVRDFAPADTRFPPHVALALQQDAFNSLMDAIKSTVAPDSWRDNGGSIGSIRELNGILIVNQTSDNQIAVQGFLALLRGAR